MKAILQYQTATDGKVVKEMKFFDTEKSKKICDIRNTFGNKVKEMYISRGGIIFVYNIFGQTLEVENQEGAKADIAAKHPDKYIEIFGEVEEA